MVIKLIECYDKNCKDHDGNEPLCTKDKCTKINPMYWEIRKYCKNITGILKDFSRVHFLDSQAYKEIKDELVKIELKVKKGE